MNRLQELLKKEEITTEELNEIWEDENVKEIQNIGASGLHVGQTWYVVVLQNAEEISVYSY